MGREGEQKSLFETERGKASVIYRVFAATILLGICFIWAYRLSHAPHSESGQAYGTSAWLGLLAAELWFGFYWILTQSLRWKLTYRQTFKERLSQRYEDEELPGVDVFVCTADPTVEPPAMVVSTVLSVMAYEYPPEKLAVYLSDDGGSDLTFYALMEASEFARHWVPYCKEFHVEPRSLSAYFRSMALPAVRDAGQAAAFVAIKVKL